MERRSPVNFASQQCPQPQNPGALDDYERVRRAIAFVSQTWREQPSLDVVADHVGLSGSHFQHLFKRWAGISPKAFLQAITIDHARSLLRNSASVLDTAYAMGPSGPGRLHNLFVDQEAMTPSQYKLRGEGIEMTYGFHESPFGKALIMAVPRGVSGLAFANEGGERAALGDLTARWPQARYRQDQSETVLYAARIFTPELWRATDPLKIVFIGAEFEIRVWQTLLAIPMAQAVTYSDIARHLGAPKAMRAVGSAVGRNPISFVVPCHRVLRKGGGLGGYHWGITRKQAIIGWEAAKTPT